ncbi:MAG: MFS transporter, partial [Anaerolineae bacterium]|nr:MFS transporter [Anaerolineae bacterium]
MSRRNPESLVLKITLLLTSMLMVMVTTAVAPALPEIQAHFAEVPRAALWVRLLLTLPALFIAATAPVVGYIIDRIGRKRVLVLSTLLFGISGVAGYVILTLPLLLISRALLGIAVGAQMTAVTTLIADYYTGAERGRFMGLQAAVLGFGATAFIALGGILADVGWRLPFLTHSVAFVILPFVMLALYEPTVGEQCVETPVPVSDPGLCVAESIRMARTADSAERAASSRPLRFLLFVYLLVMGSQIVSYFIPVQLPFYLQGAVGASASQSGLALSVTTILYASASLLYSRVAAWLDHFQVFVVAFALVGAGYLLIWSAGGWALILLGLSLVGIGLGLLTPNLNVWLADETPPALRGSS